MKELKGLRGRGAFHHLRNSGRLERGNLVSCFFKTQPNQATVLSTGFAVSGDRRTAVQRNRIKRLMKEAFRLESSVLQSHLRSRKKQVALLFVFKTSKNRSLYQVRFNDVRIDIARMIRVVTSKT